MRNVLPTLPAPYLIVREFLSAAEHEALLAWTLAHEAEFELAKVKRDSSSAVDTSVRNCLKFNDAGPSREVFVERLKSKYLEWLKQLRVSPFEMGETEVGLTAYGDGAHFRFHVDTARASANNRLRDRRLTAVYYYFREPKQFTGGEIRLFPLGHGAESEDFLAIPPEQNMLLVFPSWAGHDVTTVQCASSAFADARFAVNCWLNQPESASVAE